MDFGCAIIIANRIIEIIMLFWGIEGPWKRKNLAEIGLVTQCIAPTRLNDQYVSHKCSAENAKVLLSLL